MLLTQLLRQHWYAYFHCTHTHTNLKPGDGMQKWASVRHLWREIEKQREPSTSFQEPSHGLLECWWAPGVWGNVLSPNSTYTHRSSPVIGSGRMLGNVHGQVRTGLQKWSELYNYAVYLSQSHQGRRGQRMRGREQWPQMYRDFANTQYGQVENRWVCGENKCPSVSRPPVFNKTGTKPCI